MARRSAADVPQESAGVHLVGVQSKKAAKSSPQLELSTLPDTAANILAPLDINGDGFLDSTELIRAAELLKASKESNRILKVGMVGAIFIVFAIVASNAIISVLAFDHFTTTSVKSTQDGHPSILVTKDSSLPVTTGRSEYRFSLHDPAATVSPDGDYKNIHTVSFASATGRKAAFSVAGYQWYNASVMAFYLTIGQTMVVAHGSVYIRDGIDFFAEEDTLTAPALAMAADGRRLLEGRRMPPAVAAACIDGGCEAVAAAVADVAGDVGSAIGSLG